MPFLPVNIFCKSAHCPTSETLLDFLRSGVSRREKAFVEEHLAFCEFCSAELQLLERYRYGAKETVVAEMPAHLRRLAEELLPQRMIGIGSVTEAVESHQLSN